MENYYDRDIQCCYNCSHHEEEAEGQYCIWCKLKIPDISPLGICDLYENE